MDIVRTKIGNICSRGRNKQKAQLPTKATKEVKNIDARNFRVSFPRVLYGIERKLDQIFARHIQDAEEKRKLLQFCQKKVCSTFRRLENSGDSFLHNIIASLPDDSEFESHKYFNTKVVETLIEDGCDIKKPDSKGNPALIAAYKLDKLSAVKGFLNKRVDINVTDKFGASLVILVAKNNDLKTLKWILSLYKLNAPKVDLDLLDASRNCAVSYATLNNNIDICQELLEAGANPNAGFTSPLYQAVKNDCCTDLIALLILHKARVDVWVDFTGLTTLIASANKNRTEVVILLLKAGAHFPSSWHKNKAFMSALKFDNLEIIIAFLERSTEIVSRSSKGTNILHDAAAYGSSRILDYLIMHTDMDLNAKDRYGKTAFFLGAENGHVKCLEILYRASVQCFLNDVRGRNPLDIAVFNDHYKCVEFILNHLVCPRSHLVNVCNVLKAEYDQSEFTQSETVTLLGQFTQSCEGNNVGSLLDLCILRERKTLGPKSEQIIQQLPLPSVIKTLLLLR